MNSSKFTVVTCNGALASRILYETYFCATNGDDMNLGVGVTYRTLNLHSFHDNSFLYISYHIYWKISEIVYVIFVVVNTHVTHRTVELFYCGIVF